MTPPRQPADSGQVVLPQKDDTHFKNPRIWGEYVRLQKHDTCDRVATLESHVVLGLAREGLLRRHADWSGVMGGKDNGYGKLENK